MYLSYTPPAPAPDLTKYNEIKVKLEQQKKTYEQEIKNVKSQQAVYLKQIDSLLAFNVKIKYVYIKEQREIDSLENNDLVDEFSKLFTNLKLN